MGINRKELACLQSQILRELYLGKEEGKLSVLVNPVKVFVAWHIQGKYPAKIAEMVEIYFPKTAELLRTHLPVFETLKSIPLKSTGSFS